MINDERGRGGGGKVSMTPSPIRKVHFPGLAARTTPGPSSKSSSVRCQELARSPPPPVPRRRHRTIGRAPRARTGRVRVIRLRVTGVIGPARVPPDRLGPESPCRRRWSAPFDRLTVVKRIAGCDTSRFSGASARKGGLPAAIEAGVEAVALHKAGMAPAGGAPMYAPNVRRVGCCRHSKGLASEATECVHSRCPIVPSQDPPPPSPLPFPG